MAEAYITVASCKVAWRCLHAGRIPSRARFRWKGGQDHPRAPACSDHEAAATDIINLPRSQDWGAQRQLRAFRYQVISLGAT